MLEYFLQNNMVSADQARVVAIEQERTGESFENIMLRLGFISKDSLLHLMSNRNKIECVDLSSVGIDKETALTLSNEYCQKNKVIVFCQTDEEVYVATANEDFLPIRDYVQKQYSKQVKFFQAKEQDIMESIDYVFNNQAKNWVDLLDRDYSEQESFAIRVIYDLIAYCIKKGASDLHLEPEECFVRVRYRKDGILFPLCVFPKEKWGGLCVRVKILCGMDISQTLQPQDGRFEFSSAGKNVDLRVSTHPVVFGENIVIRILDKNKTITPLEKLGYSPNNMQEISKILEKTNGMFIVTGPTGSGKSTLLFAMLLKLHNSAVSITTIEEPVEYTFPYFRQMDMSANKNISFAEAMRSILRQDPDILSVNEIRDSDTAEVAMRAAMTGKLVLTTLHTNDIFGVFDRMVDLGVNKTMLLGHLTGVASQRLVRKVCKKCCKQRVLTEREKDIFADYRLDSVCDAVGCEECNYTGYKNRMAVCQVICFNDEVRQIIADNDMAAAKKILYEKGLKTLEKEMKERIISNQTTVEEVNRVFCIF